MSNRKQKSQLETDFAVFIQLTANFRFCGKFERRIEANRRHLLPYGKVKSKQADEPQLSSGSTLQDIIWFGGISSGSCSAFKKFIRPWCNPRS
ncbi:MAG: hypothetical protein KME40_04600 [Komarekiella atlantica HA4396-MV6]|nr:hypothetical protein [Komarekiella atlantica HA4396-MV6]